MKFFENFDKLADKALNGLNKASETIAKKYKEEKIDELLNKTGESIVKAGKKTSEYLDGVAKENRKIIDSVKEDDLEGNLTKATAVILNTTNKLVKDGATVTKEAFDHVSKRIEEIVKEETKVKKQKLFLSDGEIAELDAMPIEIFTKKIGATLLDENTKTFSLEGFTFVSNNQKWFDSKNQMGGTGAISLVEHYIKVKNNLLLNTNEAVKLEIKESGYEILLKIKENAEYKNELSSWIKEQNKTVVKKPAVKKVEPKEIVITKEIKPVAKKTVKAPAKKSTVKPKEKVVEELKPKAPRKKM